MRFRFFGNNFILLFVKNFKTIQMMVKICFSFIFVVLFLASFPLFSQNDYEKIKAEAHNLQKKYAALYLADTSENARKKLLEKAAKDITELLTKKIFPEWYGTAWQFDGTSQVPKKGAIACGYFVSTSLRDAAFKVNRAKTAQQAPLQEAKTVACGVKVEEIIFKGKIDTLKSALKKYPSGLYFIGLAGFHVGFLYISNEGAFFVHSDYSLNSVESQPLHDSYPLRQAINVYIAPISNNPVLIRKWIKGESIPVITD